MRRARIAAWALVACIATGGAQAEVVTELYGRAGPTPESEREALRGWLRAMGAAAPVATPHVALSPPPRQPTGVAPAGDRVLEVVLEILATGLAVDGQPVPDGAALGASVKRAQGRLAIFDPTRQDVVAVDVDGAARWAQVSAALAALSAQGFSDVRLRFVRPAPAPPFAASAIDGELREIAGLTKSTHKAERVAALIPRVFSGCPRALKAFAGLSTIAPADKARVYFSLLDRQLAEPACVVDAPSVQAISSMMFGGVVIVGATLHLDRKAKTRVTAAAGTTWRDAVAAGVLDRALGAPRSVAFDVSR